MRLPNNWKLIGDLIFIAEIILHIVRHFLDRWRHTGRPNGLASRKTMKLPDQSLTKWVADF